MKTALPPGFGTQTDDHGLAIWQWGDYGIFRNYVMAYPAAKSAVVYLTNSFFGLGVSPELVARSLGGQALLARAKPLEAFFGALYLDLGYDFTRRIIINRIIRQFFNIDELVSQEMNFKSRLIEWAQKEKNRFRSTWWMKWGSVTASSMSWKC
jgi:dsRNA-specific ribonuclease